MRSRGNLDAAVRTGEARGLQEGANGNPIGGASAKKHPLLFFSSARIVEG